MPTPRTYARSDADGRARELAERVKELECLYAISRLVADQVTPLSRIMQQIVHLLPRAWLHPVHAVARIRLRRREFRSADYREPVASQRAAVVFEGRSLGFVEVGYARRCPVADEGPFLAEERALLEAAARRVGDIIELREATSRLARSQRQLRSLAAQLTRTEEDERRHLATALHDRIGHTLAIAKLKVDTLAQRAGPGQGAHVVVSELLREAIGDVRSLTFEISPPVLYECGLRAALEWLAEQTCTRLGLQVEVAGAAFQEPSDEVRALVFRAVQELLTNVAKHARAAHVWVTLEQRAGRLVVEVADDGRGFSARSRAGRFHGGFGLFSIGERLRHLGGALSIDSHPGHGARIQLSAPLARRRASVR